jgi:S-adenosylmethionine:tRNA ribosyltransferase-isomerase
VGTVFYLFEVSYKESLDALIGYLKRNRIETLEASTQILIIPSYRFRGTDILITNYHQPNSTLLLLIAAFTGDDWRLIYDHALMNNYRFLSYGDSSVLFSSKYCK